MCRRPMWLEVCKNENRVPDTCQMQEMYLIETTFSVTMASAKVFPVRLFQVSIYLKTTHCSHFRNWGISHCCSDLHWSICPDDESLYLLKGEYLLDKCNNLHIYINFYKFQAKYVPTSCDGSGFVASLTVPKLSTAAQPQCKTSVLKITIRAETTSNNKKIKIK